MRIKISGLVLIVLIVPILLAACASPKIATELAHPTESPQPSPTSMPEPTLTSTPVPLVEPVLPALPSGILPVTPPTFKTTGTLETFSFTLSAAHAVYAWYRQQEGPAMWTSDHAFISDMTKYAKSLEAKGIKLKQTTIRGQTFSLLVRGNEILLNFDTDGALSDSDPGRWGKDSAPEWINVGSPVELFFGEDGHAYVAKVDSDGNVTAFLNTIGATKDNLDQQWIEVRDGQSTMVWDAQKGWIENPLALIPSEWQGKIDHIETLPEGRTVAIAAADNPDEESLLRVLQLDVATNEWIQYQPQIGISGNWIDKYGIEWQESLAIPELKIPLVDVNGDQFPLGYIGITRLGESETETQRVWMSGIIAGARILPEELCTQFVIAYPTATGDFQLMSYFILYPTSQPNMIGTHLGWLINSQKLDLDEYNYATLLVESESQIKIQKRPHNMAGFASYLLNPNLVGTQIAVGVNALPKAVNAPVSAPVWQLVDILEGTQPVSNAAVSRSFYSWIIPKSMLPMLDK